jgi:hypothetical protein
MSIDLTLPVVRWPSSNRRLLAAAWALGLLAVSVCGGCDSQRQRRDPAVVPAGQVQLQIDFNGRAENKQFHLDWKNDLTVFACLESLRRDGKLTITSRGSGAQAFVIAIDGLENSGAGGDNWIYYVNDQLGDASAGVRVLQPDDRVVWRFGPYAPK